MNDKYDVIIGLEIHIQTKTNTKMFCGCGTDYFHKEPNTKVCPVCLGLPGALPVPNKRALELCILMGLATNCDIDNEIHFDRKHYFYPDLPKGYQISQYKRPICSNGYVDISYKPSPILPIVNTRVEIERIHQEEDVAKSTHHGNYSLIDYNKSGIPLIEIVTKPCIRNSQDATAYATKIRQIARYLEISDADMEKGQMRCEPNISVQLKDTWEYKDGMILPKEGCTLNSKVEVKNIGSISAVGKSIDFEVERLIKCIESGEEIKQQTRGWNADKGITEFQRSKETADDYRYMPEPDIPLIQIFEKDIERISEELIELPSEKFSRYIQDYKLSHYDVEVLTADRDISKFFENILEGLGDIEITKAAKLVSNTITGTIFSYLNANNLHIADLELEKEDLVQWIKLLDSEKIVKSKAEELLKISLDQKKDLSDLIDEYFEQAKESEGNLEDIVREVIQSNTKAVEDFKGGKESTIGFLIGQVMQRTKGTSNPNDVKDILLKILKNEN